MELVRYETDHGQVELSHKTIRDYLVSGDSRAVTEQELTMFLALCRYQRLNPFLREAYLIKYGDVPATIVTGKDVFTKRAAANPQCSGWEAGIIVARDQKIEYRQGAFLAPGEELLGGWAKIYRRDWAVPLETTVSLIEYMRLKKDGTPQKNWKELPATMIRKVALVQGLREAMPQDFQGLYSPEEMPIDASQLDVRPVRAPQVLDFTPTAEPTLPQPQTQAAPLQAQPAECISAAQMKRMYAMSGGRGDVVKSILKNYGYERSEHVKKSDYEAICEEIAQAKDAKEAQGAISKKREAPTAQTMDNIPF